MEQHIEYTVFKNKTEEILQRENKSKGNFLSKTFVTVSTWTHFINNFRFKAIPKLLHHNKKQTFLVAGRNSNYIVANLHISRYLTRPGGCLISLMTKQHR